MKNIIKIITKNLFLLLTLIIINSIAPIKNHLLYEKSIINLPYIIIQIVISFLILFILNYLRKKQKISKQLFLFFSSIIFLYNIFENVFNSLNTFGFLLLYMFLILIALACMIITTTNFEISLVLSTSILILLFIIIGALDILKLSLLVILIICLACLLIIAKNRKKNKDILNNLFNSKGLKIFSILYVVAILAGVGRYVHVWDEYSYWAYAAKVVINTDSLKSLCTYVGNMNTYPPVSSIWHYIVNIFSDYSEPNLYIGLAILEFIYIMPVFMKLKKQNWLTTSLVTVCICGTPLVFGGSISYTVLYVDLLLGFLCSSAIIVQDYLKNNKLSNIYVYIILIIITLLKPSGFVYAGTLLLLFYLKDLNDNKITIKLIFNKLKKYIIPGIIIILSYLLWVVYSTITKNESIGYFCTLLPDSLKADLAPKLTISFIANFLLKVMNSFNETVIYSFINLSFFAFIIIIFYSIYLVEKRKGEKGIRVLLPYILSYIVFFALTVLSLYVMFSYYEASQLASFSRYLAPINIALIIYVLYKIIGASDLQKYLQIICICIIIIIGFSNITFFFTDIKDREDIIQIKDERISSFLDIINNTEENSRVFIINQTDEDSIMPLWYARYYCYPRITNASSGSISWKIKTVSNEWDLQDWGLDINTFQKHLIEYDFDYLFIYSYTDELVEELKILFEENVEIENCKLFKVETISDEKVKLIPQM